MTAPVSHGTGGFLRWRVIVSRIVIMVRAAVGWKGVVGVGGEDASGWRAGAQRSHLDARHRRGDDHAKGPLLLVMIARSADAAGAVPGRRVGG